MSIRTYRNLIAFIFCINVSSPILTARDVDNFLIPYTSEVSKLKMSLASKRQYQARIDPALPQVLQNYQDLINEITAKLAVANGQYNTLVMGRNLIAEYVQLEVEDVTDLNAIIIAIQAVLDARAMEAERGVEAEAMEAERVRAEADARAEAVEAERVRVETAARAEVEAKAEAEITERIQRQSSQPGNVHIMSGIRFTDSRGCSKQKKGRR